MKGEPDHIMVQSDSHSAFAWGVMALFGVVVVLLLLNLLIARFAKTFDMVYENVDANFKVAFARVVMAGYNKELLQPPLHLLRVFAVQLDACVGRTARCRHDTSAGEQPGSASCDGGAAIWRRCGCKHGACGVCSDK